MIKIIECIPQKISGRTAFHVFFDYNPSIIETLKTFSPAVGLKNAKCGEISANYLSRLLDALTYYDDIDLQLLSDEIQEISLSDDCPDWIRRFVEQPR